MTEPDFAALRSGVEQHTRLPDFDDVAARGRRRLRRRRLATTLWSLAAMIVCLPGLAYIGLVLTSNSGRPGVVEIAIANGGNADATNAVVTLPAPARAGTVTARLVAADGVDLAHSYGLIDACRDSTCSLQLISLGHEVSTERIGLLRKDPTDTLESARVVALDQTDVMVSADVGNSMGPLAETLSLGPIFATKRATTSVEPIQRAALGKIEEVSGGDAKIHSIPRQPTLSSVNLASDDHGWWVTGDDPSTGQLAVSLSNDQGATWRTTALGVPPQTGEQPALATADGTNVYVLVRSGSQMLLIRSNDGGQTWAAPIPEASWTATDEFGLITPVDGSVGVWFSDGADTVSYRRSTDHGATFTPVTGSAAPTGRVVTVSGGYVTLGAHPTTSVDGHIWHRITIPVVPPD
jgi:hypothetical protein